MSSSAKIVRNGGYAAFGRLWTAATSFVIMPLLLHTMSVDGFGLWQLFLRIIFFLGLVDIGVGPALAKYVAEYLALGDRERMDRSINAAYVFYIGLGILTLIVGFLLTDEEWRDDDLRRALLAALAERSSASADPDSYESYELVVSAER